MDYRQEPPIGSKVPRLGRSKSRLVCAGKLTLTKALETIAIAWVLACKNHINIDRCPEFEHEQRMCRVPPAEFLIREFPRLERHSCLIYGWSPPNDQIAKYK